MEDLLEHYAHEGNTFAQWALQDTLRADKVRTDLLAAMQAVHSSSGPVIQAGRDAANHLHMAARDAVLMEWVDFYYGRYEWLCRRLLAYL